ncbi:unnamed protein product [Lymnaea stagnalis]|uniref:Uncharacterized protein n=1 Tax=Lymnaea stagnalis TaxID=6523 RepID=A0AAV2HX53_LYMST
MVDPVVSSRFGTRPLLDVPAMLVSGHSGLEVSSLQSPAYSAISANPFPRAHNPMLGAGIYNPPSGYNTTGGLPPPQPGMYGGLDRRHHSAPQAGFFNQPPQQYFYGPNGEVVNPAPFYNPQAMYPGVANPYPYQPYAPVPQHVPQHVPVPVPVRVPYPSYGPFNPGFSITCDLEFGRVMSIDVRESQGEFRGIPDFLKEELMRTYGKYPFTEVKIKLENGEFHIYATHDRRTKNRHRRRRRARDSDTESEYNFDDEDDEEDRFIRFDAAYKSDVDSYTSGVRPRNPEMRPRGIIRERGWNRYR